MKFAVALSISAVMWAAGPLVPGVGNFAQVDERLYRGGQPSAEGLNSLVKLGVKTVVDLRNGERKNGEREAVEKLGMKYVQVPLNAFSPPTEDQVAKVLALLEPPASSDWPVFIHCMRGKDRTGVIVATYRIVHDRWDNRRALEEARAHGMSRMERSMQQFILNYKPDRNLSTR